MLKGEVYEIVPSHEEDEDEEEGLMPSQQGGIADDVDLG